MEPAIHTRYRKNHALLEARERETDTHTHTDTEREGEGETERDNEREIRRHSAGDGWLGGAGEG